MVVPTTKDLKKKLGMILENKVVQKLSLEKNVQVLRHQRGGWCQKMAIFDDLQCCKSSKRWVGGSKKVTNMMT